MTDVKNLRKQVNENDQKIRELAREINDLKSNGQNGNHNGKNIDAKQKAVIMK